MEVYEEDINMLVEELQMLIEQPFNINRVTKEDLERIPFLSPLQIENLLYYRYAFGDFQTLHELLLVEQFDRRTIDLVKPFFEVGPPPEKDVDKLLKRGRQQVLIRFDRNLNRKDGYVDKPDSVLQANPNKQYRGSPFYHSVRYRFEQKERLLFGINAEKDAGESFRGSFPFYDFASFYLSFRNRGVIKNLTVGSYKVSLGSGLVINNGFSLGKSVSGLNLFAVNEPVKAHTSVDEYNYLQGIAAHIRLSRWLLTPFWSYRTIDATTGCHHLESIKKDGLHRLDRDEEKRDRAHLLTTGVGIGYAGTDFRIGINTVWHRFSASYEPVFREYNRHAFRGKSLFNFSTDYLWRKKWGLFRGETAFSDNGAVATMNAFQIAPSGMFTLTVIQRYYHKRYQSWFSKGFSEGSEVANESGVYMTVRCRPGKSIDASAAIDIFRFPWLKYGIDAPSSGCEAIFQISYQPFSNLHLSGRYRLKKKEKNNTVPEDAETLVESYQRQTASLSMQCNLSETFFFKTSVDGTLYRFAARESAKGGLIGQSAGYKPSGIPFQLDLSYSVFDTDDSSSKVYVNEKNILYGFGTPSFYGKGFRSALSLRYDPLKPVSLWIKVGHTRYFDRSEIGSGLELIRRNSKTDLWTQLRVRF